MLFQARDLYLTPRFLRVALASIFFVCFSQFFCFVLLLLLLLTCATDFAGKDGLLIVYQERKRKKRTAECACMLMQFGFSLCQASLFMIDEGIRTTISLKKEQKPSEFIQREARKRTLPSLD